MYSIFFNIAVTFNLIIILCCWIAQAVHVLVFRVY